MTRPRFTSCALSLLLISLAGCGGSAEARRDKYLARAKELVQKQEYSRAILEFRNAAQAKPRDAEVFYQMGMAFCSMQDFASAVNAFKKAVQYNPKHFEAQLRLSQIYVLTDDKDLQA